MRKITFEDIQESKRRAELMRNLESEFQAPSWVVPIVASLILVGASTLTLLAGL